MSWFKKAFLLSLVVLVATLTKQFCTHKTDGFFPFTIPKSLSHHPEWEVALDHTILKEKAWDHPFTYLGKGHQCFVFESYDHKWVLKLPFHSSLLPSPWLRALPFFSERSREKRMLHKEKKLNQDAMSYVLAFNHFKEESGLLYLHLNRTRSLCPTITLIDKIGVHHKLPLDDVEFILQKKAEEMVATLQRWVQEGKIDMAKEGLSKLVQLFRTRLERGLEDAEQNITGNFGFVDDALIQMDIGRFSQINSLKGYNVIAQGNALGNLEEEIKRECSEPALSHLQE